MGYFPNDLAMKEISMAESSIILFYGRILENDKLNPN